MIPGICWTTFNTKNKSHINALNNTGFKVLRIFFNLADIRQKRSNETWQSYINDLYQNLPDGMHAWTYEGKTGLFSDNARFKDSIDFCKKLKWLPIICIGYQEEEPHNWIGRAPGRDKFLFLAEFTHQLGLYLYNYGFQRCDVEVWNEPSKLQSLGFGYDKYIELSLSMAKAWKSVSINYKVHVFADDILRQSYLDRLLNHTELMANVDYISCHIGVGSEDSEWDDNLIAKTYRKIKELKLKVKIALTEMSVNGIWSRLNQLPYTVEMYGLILPIRKLEFGTAFRIDDLWLYTPDNLQCTSPTKVMILKSFNAKYYKPYPIIQEDEDMKLEEYYYKNKVTYLRDTKKAGIRFIQSVVGVTPDSIWGTETETKVRLYQEYNKLDIDGNVGPLTFRDMMKTNPPAYIDLQYFTATGKW